jgi:hypothetical protein
VTDPGWRACAEGGGAGALAETRPAEAWKHGRVLEDVFRAQRAIWRSQRAGIEQRAAGYRTLLRLGSEREVGRGWGDLGRVEELIDGDELRARRFDRMDLRLVSS